MSKLSKMAAKSKKRLSKIENKLLKLEKLELKDVVCSICQSILIEPVTLPCYHCFCQNCFNGSVENNALCCPLCRLRIGSWLRTATKQKNIVNLELWNFIKTKFTHEIAVKLKGGDLNLPQEHPKLRLSAPGEIRSEYEVELKRLRAENISLEQKQLQQTEELIKKIHQEEREAQQNYLKRLKEDELLAQQIQKEHIKSSTVLTKRQKCPLTKPKLKPTKIDGYLFKVHTAAETDNPLLTDDNTSSDTSTPKPVHAKPNNRHSPEVVPSYGKLLKNFIDKKIKSGTSFWNKENGDHKKEEPQPSHKEIDTNDEKHIKTKNGIKSLLVSLPLPTSGVPQCIQNKIQLQDSRNLHTGSVDSMHQELCFFKPIERTSPMSSAVTKGLPMRVPCVRADAEAGAARPERAPSRAQYIEGLCKLRSFSLADNLPSAFVIALNILKAKKDIPAKYTSTKLKNKKNSTCIEVKKNSPNKAKNNSQISHITKKHGGNTLRRTRSMGSIKDENETTPKKAKIQERKVTSERKPHLRSDSKKMNAKKRLSTSPLLSEKLNNNKVNLAVKNLSSPLKNCDVKEILQEQLRIEKMIKQEKSDMEIARKMDAELNGRRQLRRSAVKRQVTINYALRPAKKLKV